MRGFWFSNRRRPPTGRRRRRDRKSTRLNSSHLVSSYAVFCLNKRGLYQDPTKGLPQPPVVAHSAVPTGGIKNTAGGGAYSGAKISSGTLGPFNFFYFTGANGVLNPSPDGTPTN